MRSMLETIPDAMILIDARGRILSFSAARRSLRKLPGAGELESDGFPVHAPKLGLGGRSPNTD
ncbi:MAG TPA: hypothetical protein VF727_14525 [Allosphingosinicella sp.]